MRMLEIVARWETILMIAGFGAVIGWRLVRSAAFDGLFRASDGTFSPSRVQMLVATLAAAGQYLLAVLHNPQHLPTIPSGMLMAVGGSQVVYLGLKAWNIFGLVRKDRVD
jgi:hypothetical protein